MDEPRSLDSLFKEKLFRIPDYQRGYAWRREQLKDFWEDLVNLSDKRSHYTGVLTLKEIPEKEVEESDKEFWLVDDHSYKLYHIVDGQQRLTTFVIFLQAFVDLLKTLPQNKNKPDAEVFITENLSVSAIQDKYLFRTKPTGDQFRTYKFGYTIDNPSYEYLRYNILGEPGKGLLQETFYTLNLNNGKKYFREQLSRLFEQEGLEGLQDIYRRLTKRMMFNEYVIRDEFDVFVAFETMNNRGKKLSDLELLKNRLIYLTTLYDKSELDDAERKSLRDTINAAWKEVYYQLGRNRLQPLNDDEFLRAHWTMYFKYSRQTGKDYIRFLLEEQFTPQKVHKKVEQEVELDQTEEMSTDSDFADSEFDNGSPDPETEVITSAELQPTELRDFVKSLKESAVHWFNSFYPDLAENMSAEEQEWIGRLNRVQMSYFRPLVMAVLKNVQEKSERVRLFRQIEQFIFVVFRMTTSRANYGSSVFYNASRELDRGTWSTKDIVDLLDEWMGFAFNQDGTFDNTEFQVVLDKKFKKGTGYYGWSGLRYFLYEYELSLLSESRQKKLDWSDLLKTVKDKISIEHIYPQKETDSWSSAFDGISPEHRNYYNATLGNLLLLSTRINSALQNDSFDDKKEAKYNAQKKKIRNGYTDGSHSEIEVSQQPSWGPNEIRFRGIRLLKFMEDRWAFKFKSDKELEELLFLDVDEEEESEN